MPKFTPRRFLDRLLMRQPDVGERAFRALGIQGDLPEYLKDGYDLSVTAEDLTLPEFWYARRGAWFDGSKAPGPVAGQYSFVSLGHPQLAPVLAVVLECWIWNPDVAARNFVVGLAYDRGNTADANQAPRDARDNFRRSAFSVNASNNAVLQLTGEGSRLVTVPAQAMVSIPGPWILSAAKPSPTGVAGQRTQLVVQSQILNTTFQAGFTWRERAMLESEF